MPSEPIHALTEFSKIEQQLGILDNPSDLKTLDAKLAAVQKRASAQTLQPVRYGSQDPVAANR